MGLGGGGGGRKMALVSAVVEEECGFLRGLEGVFDVLEGRLKVEEDGGGKVVDGEADGEADGDADADADSDVDVDVDDDDSATIADDEKAIPIPIPVPKAALETETETETENDPITDPITTIKSLTLLATICKTILLLNEPSIIEFYTTNFSPFITLCGILEYDPCLATRPNHRRVLKEKVKFRSVIEITDGKLVELIHQSFRIAYIRHTLLRSPMLDESSTTSLGSLATFANAEIVNLVYKKSDYFDRVVLKLHGLNGEVVGAGLGLGLGEVEGVEEKPENEHENEIENENENINGILSNPWKQHPIETATVAAKTRENCLMFLRELFSIASTIQPSQKDEFYCTVACVDDLLSCVASSSSPPQHPPKINRPTLFR